MKSFHKLILKEFLGPFLVTFVVLTFLFLTQLILKYVDELAGKGVDFSTIAELMYWFTFFVIPRSLPLAILLSSLMTFGNLGQHNELTAIKSAGISLIRLMSPVFVLVLILSVGSFLFSNYLYPYANIKSWSLLYDISEVKATFELKENTFYKDKSGYAIKVGSKNTDDNTIKDVMIYDMHEHNERVNIILADSGRMYKILNDQYLVLELYDGSRYVDNPATSSTSIMDFLESTYSKTKLVMDLREFTLNRTPQERFKHNKQMKTVSELDDEINDITLEQKDDVKMFRRLIDNYCFKYHFHGHGRNAPKMKDSLLVAYQNLLGEANIKEVVNHSKYMVNRVLGGINGLEDRLRKKEKEKRKYGIEKYSKYTQAVACLMMFLIGAPIGAIIKKGGLGVPAIITIAFFILYYVLFMTGEKYAKELLAPLPLAMWSANLILLPFGLFFMYQAKNDSGKLIQFTFLSRWVSKFSSLFRLFGFSFTRFSKKENTREVLSQSQSFDDAVDNDSERRAVSIESLIKLDDNKLIDVVKNYRQYGFNNKTRETAISILENRGVSKEQLLLAGNFDNKTYDYFLKLFNAFNKYSKIALILYVVLFLNYIVSSFSDSNKNDLVYFILISATHLAYLVFLTKSFLVESQFYRALNRDYRVDRALLLYYLLGMPFYIFMYFHFREHMNEKMKEIK